MPMVSIIMPAYNTEKYIAEAIDSVLNQTYTDFELIIINDGSTDNTVELINNYQKKDKRIICIDQTNQGVSVARNKGLAIAKGRYIALLDSDDFWHGDFLSVMLEQAVKHSDCGAFYCIPEYYYDDGRSEKQNGNIIQGKITDNILPSHEIRFPMGMSSSSIIDAKLIHDYKIDFMPGAAIGEDVAFFVKLLCITSVYYVKGCYSYYRQHEGSAMKTKWNVERYSNAVKAILTVDEFCQEYAPEQRDCAQKIISYRVYRFIWHLIKNGYKKEAQEYKKLWDSWLRLFIINGAGVFDRLKCWGILKGIL